MASFSTQPIVIDAKGHLLGRLASVLSKQVSHGSRKRCRGGIAGGGVGRCSGGLMVDISENRGSSFVNRAGWGEGGRRELEVVEEGRDSS